MKKVLKILSIALTVALIIGIFSCATPVFAAEVTERDSINSTVEQLKTQVENSENKSLYEIEEERDKFTKVFQNSDGTKTAIVSATPIHYETNDGWKDIDNTLIEETNDTGNVYKNKKNDFTVTIPKEITSSKDLKVEKDGYTISFELEGSDLFSKNKKIKGNKKNKNKKSTITQNEIDTDFLDKTSGISFENVGENTSVEYEITSTGLKENIILNKKPEEQLTYKYKITAKKLEAQLNADNSVTFKNTEGEAVFEIPAPVMYDAENNISNDIDVGFSGKNGKYILIYKPSLEWLTSDLAYPVVIDPIINTRDEELGVVDTIADSSQPNENFGDLSSLYTYKSDAGEVQSFIDISSNYIIKNGAKIKTVLLGLYYTTGFFEDDTITVAAYTITSDWSESSLTYNNKPTTVNSLIERRDINRNTQEGYIFFDVTKAYTLKQDTYGVCIRQRDADEDVAMLCFASSETPIASQQPFFMIEYYESQGVEEQFDYHAFDAGRAGTAYFNDFTEQVYIERDELGLSGINMPVQIKRYFNSGLGGTYSTNHYALSGFLSSYGIGWRTNYNQMIEYHNNIDDNEAILYCNGDGQTTYFEKVTTTNGSTTVTAWEEMPDKFSNSQGYTLEFPSQYNDDVANNLQYVKIKDSAGQVYEFNSSGLLVKINSAEADSDKNITITYAENGYNISKIKDGAGREYRFSYTEYEEWLFPLLTSIQAYSASGAPITVNHNGAEVPYKMTYTYNFFDYLDVEGIPVLASATYPDDETVYYTVNDNLISLKNIDGYAVEFAFNDSNTVISEKVYGENKITNGGQLTITDENPYEKTFVDLNKTEITKQFDMYGRTINVKNKGQTNESVARTYSDDYKAQGSISYSFYNSYEQNYAAEGTNLITNGSFTTNLSGWTISSSSKVKRTANYDCVAGNETPGSLQISGVRDTAHYAAQVIDIENGMPGDEYQLDYFVRNTTHSHMIAGLGQIDTVLIAARNNVEGNEAWGDVAWVDANPFNDNWQKYSYSFEIDFEYNEIVVIALFKDQYGTVRFDDISLVNTYKVPVTENPLPEPDTGNTETSTETETENGKTETTKPEDSKCSCAECSTDNCTCVENCSEKCTEPCCNRGYTFKNDSNGVSFSITDGEKTMAMEQNINGNYYGSQIDLNGIYTGYSYDQNNGQLNYMSDGNSNVTSFYYDAMSRLNKVYNDANGISMETSYSYEKDRIKSITHNGFSYNYEYDDWGNPTSVKVGEQALVTYEYNGDNQTRDRVNTITYGNGDYTEYSYHEDNGNITAITSYTADELLLADYKYIYDSQGNIETIKNVVENTEIRYSDSGLAIYVSSEADAVPFYSYTVENNFKSVENLNGIVYTAIENMNMEDSSTVESEVHISGPSDSEEEVYKFTSVNDYFGRKQSEDFSFVFYSEPGMEYSIGVSTEYGYKDIPATEPDQKDKTTSLVNRYKTATEAYVNIIDETLVEEMPDLDYVLLKETEYLYEYDYNGNLISINLCTVDEENVETITEICSYVYDSVGQLVRENNAKLNKTFVYVYDKGGNIVRKSEYAYTTGDLGEALSTINYTYDNTWKDKLTGYGETAIQTDSMGNPLNYTGKNIFGEEVSGTLEWNGRQLSALNMGDYRYEYYYNSDGLRTSVKTYQDNELQTIKYIIWKNGKISGYFVDDQVGNNDATIKMLYDNNDEVIGFKLIDDQNDYTDTLYFHKNLQGDITDVFNEAGQLMMSYDYDAWGNVKIAFDGNSLSGVFNALTAAMYVPITYRGYMYDVDTGLYYLQSRYYNPTYGRFLNADSIMKTGEPLGANIFAYCGNNPVNFVDYDGKDALSVITNILYLLVVVAVMEADELLEDFGYIFEGATSFSYVENISGEITDIVATFFHGSKMCYDICIKCAHIDSWRDWEIGMEHISYEGHVGQFAFGIMFSLLGFVNVLHIGIIVSVVSVVADIWSFIEDIEDRKYIDFVHNKIQAAKDNNYEYIVFVRKIDKVTTNSIGISKSETIYDCIEG